MENARPTLGVLLCNVPPNIVGYYRYRIDDDINRTFVTSQGRYNDANQNDRRPRRSSPVPLRRSRTLSSYPRRAGSLSPLRDATAASHPQSN